jgi:hypothetical protein
VRVLFEQTANQGNAGDNAAGGAVVGSILFGAPAAGAIVGASSGNSGTQIKGQIAGCQFEVKVGDRTLYFVATGEGSDSQACAMLRPGDKITTYYANRGSNDLQWHGTTLRPTW